MKTILVTGGAGFIGSNFVEYWCHHHPEDKLIILDNLTYAGGPDNIRDTVCANEDKIEFWYGDVCNSDLVNSLAVKADVIVHLAAETHVARSIFDNRTFFITDVLGTQSVATAVARNHKNVERFIHVSSSEVYGSAEYEPMDEQHPLNPKSPYAAAKCSADRLVYSFFYTYGIPSTIVRPFNQYGPKQHLEKVIPRFITSALKNEPLNIHGTGEACRDWLYVTDTCERLDKIIHAPIDAIKGEIFNLGSGDSVSVLEIARKILRIVGRSESLLVFVDDRPGQVKKHISSTAKAKERLGVDTGSPFTEGLVRTIDWFEKNEEWWRKREWMKTVPIRTENGRVELH